MTAFQIPHWWSFTRSSWDLWHCEGWPNVTATECQQQGRVNCMILCPSSWSWQFTSNCPPIPRTPGKRVTSSNWLSPERSKRWGRKHCGPEALCRLLDQWPVSAGFYLMMLEPAPALLTAILTTDTHTQETGFWKDQIIASFCSMWNFFFFLKVYALHFMFIGSVLRF